jgi:hypothetical protein
MSNIIGRGTKTTVIEYSDSLVEYQGNFRRDSFKLAVLAVLGKLHSIHVTGKNYTALVELMYDDRFQSDNERYAIEDCIDFVQQLSDTCYDDNDFLSRLTNDRSQLGHIARFVLTLGINVNNCQFWVDNHTGNFLVDQSGEIVPFDLFDFDYTDLSGTAKDTIQNMLLPFIQ